MKKDSEKRYLLVHCDKCEATVSAEVLAEHEVTYFDEDVRLDLPDNCVSLVACSSCHRALVAREVWEGEDDSGISIWSKPIRVWPRPERESTSMFPDIVRASLEEAQRCHRAAAYTASAVMCGRALEGVCVHFDTKDRNLNKGLKELLDRQLIDQRLFEWSEELRKHRNLAAHASGEKVSREDATDLLDFVNAICEYVFILTPKFHSYMERKSTTKK